MKYICTIILLSMLFIFTLSAQEKLTTAQWKQDIMHMAKEMPLKHLDLFKKMNKADFEQAVTQLEKKLANLERHEIIVEIAKIVALVNDGHSFLDGYHPLFIEYRFSTYPIRLYHYSDGIYIQSAHKTYKKYLGAKILSINDKNIDDCSEIVSKMFPVENEMGAKAWAKYGLTSPEVLNALKIIDTPDKATFQIELNGIKLNLDLELSKIKAPEESFGVVVDPDWISANNLAKNEMPLHLRNLEKMYWYNYNPLNKIFYVQFNEVNDWGNQNVLDFFDEVVSKVSSLEIKRFVLDLRLNRGGETKFNNPIVKKLISSSKINKKGTFFVLIGRRTFSSAQLIVTGLEQYSYATFLGEPSGINTHFFANSRKNLVLPNSKLTISLSTNWWQPTNRKDMRKWQGPDIAIEESFQDYQSNIDPVMNEVLDYKEPINLEETLQNILGKETVDYKKLISEFRKYKNLPKYKYVNTEHLINGFAYLLFMKEKMNVAISFLKFNTIDYPNSANTFDSLAEAYMYTGNNKLSITNYQKSIELDPNNSNATEMIKKIKSRAN